MSNSNSTQMVGALDAAYAGIDHARSIVDCLAEGLTVTGGGLRADVAYSPAALFSTLNVVGTMLNEAYEQIEAINKLWAEVRDTPAKEARR